MEIPAPQSGIASSVSAVVGSNAPAAAPDVARAEATVTAANANTTTTTITLSAYVQSSAPLSSPATTASSVSQTVVPPTTSAMIPPDLTAQMTATKPVPGNTGGYQLELLINARRNMAAVTTITTLNDQTLKPVSQGQVLRMIAHSPVPVTPGSVMQLQWTPGADVKITRINPPAGIPPAVRSFVGKAMASQGSPGPLLQSLQQVLSQPHTTRVLPEAAFRLAGQLLAMLPDNNTITQPGVLEKFVGKSGLFLESSFAHAVRDLETVPAKTLGQLFGQLREQLHAKQNEVKPGSNEHAAEPRISTMATHSGPPAATQGERLANVDRSDFKSLLLQLQHLLQEARTGSATTTKTSAAGDAGELPPADTSKPSASSPSKAPQTIVSQAQAVVSQAQAVVSQSIVSNAIDPKAIAPKTIESQISTAQSSTLKSVSPPVASTAAVLPTTTARPTAAVPLTTTARPTTAVLPTTALPTPSIPATATVANAIEASSADTSEAKVAPFTRDNTSIHRPPEKSAEFSAKLLAPTPESEPAVMEAAPKEEQDSATIPANKPTHHRLAHVAGQYQRLEQLTRPSAVRPPASGVMATAADAYSPVQESSLQWAASSAEIDIPGLGLPLPHQQRMHTDSSADALENLLGLLLKRTQESLSRLHLHQLAHSGTTTHDASAQQQNPPLTFDLPVFFNGQIQIFNTRIEEEELPAGENGADEKKVKQWSVSMGFDIEGLGPMFCQLKMTASHANLQFWADHPATLALTRDNLGFLSQSLNDLGVSVSEVHCHEGLPKQTRTRLSQQLVDIST